MTWTLQKASFGKRVSAWLFDVILLVITSVLCMWGLSALIGFNAQYERLTARYETVAAQYELNLSELSAAYSELSPEQQQKVELANQALSADGEAVYAYRLVTQMTILMISIGILLACLALEFFVPLWLQHGRTLGKKIFGVAVMRQDGVQLSPVSLFIRTVLGKYAVETMLPVMLALMFAYGALNPIALMVGALLLLAQAGLMLFTSRRTPIHDLLAQTVTADFASQRIFRTQEELIAFKEAAQAELAAHQNDWQP